jgi:hypothetical protein
MRCEDGVSTDDDWLFTDVLSLDASVDYYLDFWYKVSSSYIGYDNNLEVYIGDAQNSGAMTTKIWEETDLHNTVYQMGSAPFTVSSTGTYYIGFHRYNGYSNADLFLDDAAIYTLDSYYDVDVVVHEKTGFVKSTNPGQLYGVISITGPVSEIDITDNFDYEFDINPAHLGGGVEVIMVDPYGFATILTDEPGISADVYNDLNYVDISIDLNAATGGPLPDGWTLMVYVKFQTAMKHELWEGDFDEYFDNTVEIEIDENPLFTTGAQIYLTEK